MKICIRAVALAMLMLAGPASATLIGDDVGVQFNVNGFGFQFNNTVTVIDPGSEASFAAGIVDIGMAGFSFDYTAAFDVDFSTLVLTGLDAGGAITGVTLLSGEAANVLSTVFTADSITIEFSNVDGTQNDDRFYDFSISVDAVPEPSIMALLALGLSSLGFSRRRAISS